MVLFRVSPLRSGFISALKRNFIFAPSGQGHVAFERIPSYCQEKSQGGTHTAAFKRSHSERTLLESLMAEREVVLEELCVTLSAFITRSQIMTCEHLLRNQSKLGVKGRGQKIEI